MAKIKTRKKNNSHRPGGVHKLSFEKVYWPYIPIVLAVSLLLALNVSATGFSAFIKNPAGQVLGYSTSMSNSALLVDTNNARVANGVASLNPNDQLSAAAQSKANDMASRNYWSHNTPEGNPPWIFVTNQGYAYHKLGENLAAGFDNEQATIDGWMASPDHRENLLDPSFTDVGFGFANNADYTAAGGGPMTIVVAYYGEPLVKPLPAAAAPITPSVRSDSVANQTPAATPSAPSSNDASEPKNQPVTTKNTNLQAKKPVKTTRIQAKTSQSRFAPFMGLLTMMAIVIVGVLWLSKHLKSLRRGIKHSERYILHHPLADAGAIVILVLLIALLQTTGLVL